jgi:hypothetical protein
MDDSWIYIEGRRNGRAYMAAVRHPLAEMRHPEYEHHVALTLDYAPHWRTGLPKPKELLRLQDLEDRLSSRVEGHGVLAGAETTDAKRTVHLYIRGGGPMLEMYRDRERGGKQGGVAVTVTHDPDWQGVAHLTDAGGSAPQSLSPSASIRR